MLNSELSVPKGMLSAATPRAHSMEEGWSETQEAQPIVFTHKNNAMGLVQIKRAEN